VCIAVSTVDAHNTAQNKPDNFHCYPPDNFIIAPMMFVWRKRGSLDCKFGVSLKRTWNWAKTAGIKVATSHPSGVWCRTKKEWGQWSDFPLLLQQDSCRPDAFPVDQPAECQSRQHTSCFWARNTAWILASASQQKRSDADSVGNPVVNVHND